MLSSKLSNSVSWRKPSVISTTLVNQGTDVDINNLIQTCDAQVNAHIEKLGLTATNAISSVSVSNAPLTVHSNFPLPSSTGSPIRRTSVPSPSTITNAPTISDTQTLLPLISAFENSLNEHQKLKDTLIERLNSLRVNFNSNSNNLLDNIQSSKLASINHSFQLVFDRLGSLERVHEESLQIASRSGVLIDQTHRQNRKCKEVKELFTIYARLFRSDGGGKGNIITSETQSESDTYNNNLISLEDILTSISFTNDWEIAKRGAKLMRRLKILATPNTVSAEDSEEIPGNKEVSRQIEEAANLYEERLLKDFHQTFQQHDLPRMRRAASLLIRFNGGASCVQTFVSQHAFFQQPIRIDTIISRFHSTRITNDSNNSAVIDFSSSPPSPDPILLALYEQIVQTVEADWSYLKAVFEEPVMVMNYLLQRIFQEPVRIHLEEILRQARNHSQLAYLRTLWSSYRGSRDLIQRLISIYERNMNDDSDPEAKLLQSANPNATIFIPPNKMTNRFGNLTKIISSANTHLSSLLSELFSPFLGRPVMYLELEKNTFTELIEMSIGTLISLSHTPSIVLSEKKRLSPSNGARNIISQAINKTASQIAMIGNTPLGSASTISSSNSTPLGNAISSMSDDVLFPPADGIFLTDGEVRANMHRFPGGIPLFSRDELIQSRSTSTSTHVPPSGQYLSETFVRNVLFLHAEMSYRLYSLLPSSNMNVSNESSSTTATNTLTIINRGDALKTASKLLLQLILNRYLGSSLEEAYDSIGKHGNGVCPCDVNIFEVLQRAARILSMILLYTERNLSPLMAASSPIAFRAMIQAKTEAAAKVIERIDAVLWREHNAALYWLENGLLAKQRKSDFKPKGDNLEALSGPSQACLSVCEFVSMLAKGIRERMDESNATNFLVNIGIGLHSLLLTHFKSFTISDSGAMILQNDLRRYREILQSPDIMGPAAETLYERYEMLWELGHLFLVRPENLPSILQEGYLGRLDSQLLYPYLALRTDCGTAEMMEHFPELERGAFGTRIF